MFLVEGKRGKCVFSLTGLICEMNKTPSLSYVHLDDRLFDFSPALIDSCKFQLGPTKIAVVVVVFRCVPSRIALPPAYFGPLSLSFPCKSIMQLYLLSLRDG